MSDTAEQLNRNADWIETWLLDQEGIDKIFYVSPKQGVYARFPDDAETRSRLFAEWDEVKKDYKTRMDGHFAVLLRSIVRSMREAAEELEKQDDR